MRPWKYRLLDIAYATRRIRHWTGGMKKDDFLRDLRTLNAVLRELEVIGEAARHIPEHVARTFPDVPWDKIRGFRHIAAHVYFRTDPDRVWKIVTEGVPILEESIKPRVARMFPGVDLERDPLHHLYPPGSASDVSGWNDR